MMPLQPQPQVREQQTHLPTFHLPPWSIHESSSSGARARRRRCLQLVATVPPGMKTGVPRTTVTGSLRRRQFDAGPWVKMSYTRMTVALALVDALEFRACRPRRPRCASSPLEQSSRACPICRVHSSGNTGVSPILVRHYKRMSPLKMARSSTTGPWTIVGVQQQQYPETIP